MGETHHARGSVGGDVELLIALVILVQEIYKSKPPNNIKSPQNRPSKHHQKSQPKNIPQIKKKKIHRNKTSGFLADLGVESRALPHLLVESNKDRNGELVGRVDWVGEEGMKP